MVTEVRPSTSVIQIKSASKFTELFQGYASMRAVSYVAETKYLVDFLSKFGYSNIELVLGEEFSDLKKNLDATRLEEILYYLEDGSLKVYIPPTRIHTKLYLLEGEGKVRIITGSRNLQQSRSHDLAVVFDFTGSHPLLTEFQSIFEEYLGASTPMFRSLLEILESASEADRRAKISYWLENVELEQKEVETPLVQIISSAMEPASEEILSISPPRTKSGRKVLKEVFGGSFVSESEDRIQIRKSDFLRLVSKEIGYPMMRISWSSAKLSLTIGGEVYDLTSDTLGDPAIISSELGLIESYIDACEPNAQDLDNEEIEMQKTGMYEIILYMFSAPFFHELMKIRSARYTVLQKRGPRFLVVYGQSHNGKTTLFEYCMKLMTGKSIEPLGSKDFRRSVVDKVRSFGTLFPLVFDDVSTISDRKSQDIIKNYWEREWKSDVPTPQLIFSTNSAVRKDWLKTRSKFTTLPMYLSSSNEKKAELSGIIGHENRIFQKFSGMYLKELGRKDYLPGDDDLEIGRKVLDELYKYALRPKPLYFPDKAYEEKFDAGRFEWRQLVYSLGKVQMIESHEGLRIDFAPEMSIEEVIRFEGLLPEYVWKDRKGNTIIVKSKKEFSDWLGRPFKRKSILGRILGRS